MADAWKESYKNRHNARSRQGHGGANKRKNQEDNVVEEEKKRVDDSYLQRWPQSLLKAVIDALQQPPNDAAVRSFLKKNDWPKGLIEALLRDINRVPVRFFIIDDSGSMNSKDGSFVEKGSSSSSSSKAKAKVITTTRWGELAQAMSFHASLAHAAEIPCEFRLLNGADPCVIGIGSKSESGDSLKFLQNVMEEPPAGQTPLCAHIRAVVNNIMSMEEMLRNNNQRAAVIIATDGEASDGDVAAALKPLENLPAILVLRLCTNDERLLNYWNAVDSNLEVEVDVLDDLCSEADEAQTANPWLTYPEYLHKMREFGSSSKELDLLDESLLSTEHMRAVVCNLLFDGKKSNTPNPDEDFDAFAREVRQKMDQNITRSQTFDMVSKRYCDLIKMDKLRAKYSGDDMQSVSCVIS